MIVLSRWNIFIQI